MYRTYIDSVYCMNKWVQPLLLPFRLLRLENLFLCMWLFIDHRSITLVVTVLKVTSLL